MWLIDADYITEGRVSNDPVVIAAKRAPTINAIPVVWLKQKRDSQSDPWDYLANALDYIFAVYKKEQEAR